MRDRGYRWDVKNFHFKFTCVTCGKSKHQNCFGTVNSFKISAEGYKYPWYYRRKECKECHNAKAKIYRVTKAVKEHSPLLGIMIKI
jgi:hypothetical protein